MSAAISATVTARSFPPPTSRLQDRRRSRRPEKPTGQSCRSYQIRPMLRGRLTTGNAIAPAAVRASAGAISIAIRAECLSAIGLLDDCACERSAIILGLSAMGRLLELGAPVARASQTIRNPYDAKRSSSEGRAGRRLVRFLRAGRPGWPVFPVQRAAARAERRRAAARLADPARDRRL